MIFTHHNVARRCAVFDVEAGTRLDEAEAFAVEFAAIHPIYGGGPVPEMFHCYGRKSGG